MLLLNQCFKKFHECFSVFLFYCLFKKLNKKSKKAKNDEMSQQNKTLSHLTDKHHLEFRVDLDLVERHSH